MDNTNLISFPLLASTKIPFKVIKNALSKMPTIRLKRGVSEITIIMLNKGLVLGFVIFKRREKRGRAWRQSGLFTWISFAFRRLLGNRKVFVKIGQRRKRNGPMATPSIGQITGTTPFIRKWQWFIKRLKKSTACIYCIYIF